MSAPENPPAFPLHPDINPNTGRDWQSVGMTLRDWHAGNVAAAIVGSISSEDGYRRLRDLAAEDCLTVSEWIAREAGKQADALLAERTKPDPDIAEVFATCGHPAGAAECAECMPF